MTLVLSTILPDSIHLTAAEFELLPPEEGVVLFKLGTMLRSVKRSLQTPDCQVSEHPLVHAMLEAAFDVTLEICRDQVVVNEIMRMAESLGASGFRFSHNIN